MLTPHTTGRSGTAVAALAPTALVAAATSVYYFDNPNEDVVALVESTGATVLSFGPTKTIDGRSVPKLTLTTGAGNNTYIVGPFPRTWYCESITIDAVTHSSAVQLSATVGALANVTILKIGTPGIGA
jgi:hypothetical protein